MQFDQLKRREFITLLGGAAAWPMGVRAQQPARMRRIGVLMGTSENDPESPQRIAAFREALGKGGWSEGGNVAIDFRWGAGDPVRMRGLAKELIGATPDIVVAESTPATAALRDETSTIPIVFFAVANPVGSGFVASLSRPGGNITGFTNFEPTMGGKWLGLLKEIAPRIVRAAAIFNPQTHSGQYWRSIETAAPTYGIEFAKSPVHGASEIERAIKALANEPNGSLIVMPDSFTLAHRELIVALSAQYRLPSIYPFRVFPRTGGLISYGNDLVEGYRNAASYVDRILKGENSGDLPIQAPTKFELVINLKTARALDLVVPLTLQASADEVID
jgi:putative tryptophan/tyrosine transport system substrate-binding protein